MEMYTGKIEVGVGYKLFPFWDSHLVVNEDHSYYNIKIWTQNRDVRRVACDKNLDNIIKIIDNWSKLESDEQFAIPSWNYVGCEWVFRWNLVVLNSEGKNHDFYSMIEGGNVENFNKYAKEWWEAYHPGVVDWRPDQTIPEDYSAI